MDLGIFKDFWDGNPNHLPFLSLVELPGDETQSFNLRLSISKLEAILQSNSEHEIKQGIKLLLDQEDWRFHLVASISLLLIKESRRGDLFDLIWERLSKGSWVSPQLLVVLSMSDKSFIFKGEKILAEGFHIIYPKLSAVDHHVSRGGLPATISEKKVIAAINYLINDIIEDNEDNDYGGSLAQNWEEKLHELIIKNKLRLAIF